MIPPLARTNAEEHLYMQLHPCPTCGTVFEPSSSVVLIDGVLASRFSAPCPLCGQMREFTFRLPEQVLLPDPDRVFFGRSGEVSELIDAGEWLMVSDQYARSVPAQLAGLDTDSLVQARRTLTAAVSALDEVLNFIPEGADEVPAEAFWTERGRARHAAEPTRFRRVRLDARRAAFEDLLASSAR
jgi:hypothetical protein